MDVGETLSQAVERELREEVRIEGCAVRLLGVFDSRLWESGTRRQLYHVLLEVECHDPRPRVTDEATEVGFFSEADLPPLSPGHHLVVLQTPPG